MTTNAESIPAKGEMFITERAFDAILMLGVALRAYTARHDPALMPHEESWSKQCIHAGLTGRMPPLPPMVSAYGSLPIAPGFAIDLRFESVRAITLDTEPSRRLSVFMRRYYTYAVNTAHQDPLVRNVLDEFRPEFLKLNELVNCIDNA